MLNPRIYRAAFLPVLVAVVAVAFSFRTEPSALSTNLAPAAFNGQSAFNMTANLAKSYPHRPPGSAGDYGVAAHVAAALSRYEFQVSTPRDSVATAVGERTIENVIAERAGSSSGRIVVVAHRDSLRAGSGACEASPEGCSPADLSGTATLIELGRVLAGRTLNRTVELVSTSASTGLGGVTRLAGALGGPIDAVIVLGDMAGAQTSGPVIVPFSGTEAFAPLLLRNTAGAALRSQAGIAPGGVTLAGQLARLAFPLTLSEQGPFDSAGIPAVLFSRSGERAPGAGAPVSEPALAGLGAAALQTISALDAGPSVPAPGAYLTYRHMEVPVWPVRLLVLALILPVLCAAIDAFARARRRGYGIARWAAWVLAGGLPFALATLFLAGLGAVGLIQVSPPGPVPAGAVSADVGSVVEIVAAAVIFMLAMIPGRSFIVRHAGLRGDPNEAGGGAATLLVMCAIALVLWVADPFAAMVVVPALHLWMWILAPEVRLRAPVALALLLAGLAPIALVILYYAIAFGLGPLGVVWTGTLLIGGGGIGVASLLEWSVVAGCAVSVAVVAARSAAVAAPEAAPVTIRGPVTYAGPGSLGGTKSALRR